MCVRAGGLLKAQPAVTDYTTHAAQPSLCLRILLFVQYVPGFPHSKYIHCHLKMY